MGDKIKNKVIKAEEKIAISAHKRFNWGWFKFTKCLLGLLIYSLAVNLFIVPSHLYTGGILGLSQLLRTFIINKLNININIGVDLSTIIYYTINIPLFIIAYRKIGKTFFTRTIFTVTFNTLFLMLIPIPKDPFFDSIITNTLVGGIFAGIGVGMVLSTGSSTGGTDIIGIAITKHTKKITVGTVGLTFNVLIYAICGILNGLETMIYSIIYAVFESLTLDQNHLQNIKSEVFVFTKSKPDKIIKFINEELNRGATFWDAVGGYTNTKTYIVCTVLTKYERMRLERHMKELDDKAFMVGDDGVQVRGEFEKYLI